jgi:predicted membrane-bound spermidine synthase
MDWVVASGVIAFGGLIGILVGWYVNEVKAYTESVVTTAMGLFVGSGAIAILQQVAPTGSTREFWLYPVGLLIGVLIAPPIDVYFQNLYKSRKARMRGKRSPKK